AAEDIALAAQLERVVDHRLDVRTDAQVVPGDRPVQLLEPDHDRPIAHHRDLVGERGASLVPGHAADGYAECADARVDPAGVRHLDRDDPDDGQRHKEPEEGPDGKADVAERHRAERARTRGAPFTRSGLSQAVETRLLRDLLGKPQATKSYV